MLVFTPSSFDDEFLTIAADREFIPTTPEAVRIFSEVFASVDDSLPPSILPKDRPWWHVDLPLSPMAAPWIPEDEAKAISLGIQPCVVRVNCAMACAESSCPSAQLDPAVAKWRCLLCQRKYEWATQLHDHVKEWYLFLHNYFLEGRMPSFEACFCCRECYFLLFFFLSLSWVLLTLCINLYISFAVYLHRKEVRDSVGLDGPYSTLPSGFGSFY